MLELLFQLVEDKWNRGIYRVYNSDLQIRVLLVEEFDGVSDTAKLMHKQLGGEVFAYIHYISFTKTQQQKKKSYYHHHHHHILKLNSSHV